MALFLLCISFVRKLISSVVATVLVNMEVWKAPRCTSEILQPCSQVNINDLENFVIHVKIFYHTFLTNTHWILVLRTTEFVISNCFIF